MSNTTIIIICFVLCICSYFAGFSFGTFVAFKRMTAILERVSNDMMKIQEMTEEENDNP